MRSRCPKCGQESVGRKDAFAKKRACRKCYIDSVWRGGNRNARQKAIRNYKHICAKSRGLEFTLTDDELDTLFSGKCFYCDSPPSNKIRAKTPHGPLQVFVYNGIDRVDNKRGYVIDNVVSACNICNRAKGDMSQQEFMYWIERLRGLDSTPGRRYSRGQDSRRIP